MSDSDPQSIVGIGELLWDCFPERRRPGGAPANVAFHATQFGLEGWICSRVGDDEPGREIREEMRRRGLRTELIQTDPALPTGRVTVDTSDPAAPSYRIHRDVAWDSIGYERGLEEVLKHAAAVCVGTLAQRAEPSRTTIQRCLETASHAVRVYDVNLRADGFRKPWIEHTLDGAQIVKLNLDEVGTLADLLDKPQDPAAFARALLDDHDLELVCITRAERGCLLCSSSEIVDAPGTEVAVADAVGAGDAFTAALIWARLRDWSLERTARLANEVGALVASRDGAMPELRAEIAALVAGPGRIELSGRRRRA